MQRNEGASASATEGEQPDNRRIGPRYVPPRRYPQLVTKEAEEGEEQVYGDAAPVVVEWRRTYAEMMRLVKSGPLAAVQRGERAEARAGGRADRGARADAAALRGLRGAGYDRQDQLWNRRQLQKR